MTQRLWQAEWIFRTRGGGASCRPARRAERRGSVMECGTLVPLWPKATRDRRSPPGLRTLAGPRGEARRLKVPRVQSTAPNGPEWIFLTRAALAPLLLFLLVLVIVLVLRLPVTAARLADPTKRWGRHSCRPDGRQECLPHQPGVRAADIAMTSTSTSRSMSTKSDAAPSLTAPPENTPRSEYPLGAPFRLDSRGGFG